MNVWLMLMFGDAMLGVDLHAAVFSSRDAALGNVLPEGMTYEEYEELNRVREEYVGAYGYDEIESADCASIAELELDFLPAEPTDEFSTEHDEWECHLEDIATKLRELPEFGLYEMTVDGDWKFVIGQSSFM